MHEFVEGHEGRSSSPVNMFHEQREGEALAVWIRRCGMETVKRVLAAERKKYGVSEGAPLPAPSTLTELKDRAIEHGAYLATAAESYLDAKNAFDMAVAGYDDDGDAPDSDQLSDCHQALRSAIYEFRKRVARAEVGDSGARPGDGDAGVR